MHCQGPYGTLSKVVNNLGISMRVGGPVVKRRSQLPPWEVPRVPGSSLAGPGKHEEQSTGWTGRLLWSGSCASQIMRRGIIRRGR